MATKTITVMALVMMTLEMAGLTARLSLRNALWKFSLWVVTCFFS